MMFYPEEVLVAVGGHALGRSVKWTETARRTSSPRRRSAARSTMPELAVTKDGKILGSRRTSSLHDTGAYDP